MRWLFCLLALVSFGATAYADTIRVASYNIAMGRKNPGEAAAALASRHDRQVKAIVEIIAAIKPDILLINELDWDEQGEAIKALQARLVKAGVDLGYSFAPTPHTGILSGVDLNNDGNANGAEDALGFGFFRGQYAMALLSRYEIDAAAAKIFSELLWRDLEWAEMPQSPDGSDFLSEAAQAVFRFSSKGHWDVPIKIGDNVLHVLAAHPTPPVFDGSEDLNGLRNAAEIGFWSHYLVGDMKWQFEGKDFVILGTLNGDPFDGDGRHRTISTLLRNPALQDAMPKSENAIAVSRAHPRANRGHKGDPSLDTVNWGHAASGNLRADYVLPSATLHVVDSGVHWPDIDGIAARASDHRLVWADIEF